MSSPSSPGSSTSGGGGVLLRAVRRNSAGPQVRSGATDAARTTVLLRRPWSVSHSSVNSSPWTTTGSPLLTVCETLPASSPQHSTSRNSGFLSTQRCDSLSKRCAVDATRNLVTLPVAVLFFCGGLTTLPTTVIRVSFAMVGPRSFGAEARPARCRATENPAQPPHRADRPDADLWKGRSPVDDGRRRPGLFGSTRGVRGTATADRPGACGEVDRAVGFGGQQAAQTLPQGGAVVFGQVRRVRRRRPRSAE